MSAAFGVGVIGGPGVGFVEDDGSVWDGGGGWIHELSGCTGRNAMSRALHAHRPHSATRTFPPLSRLLRLCQAFASVLGPLKDILDRNVLLRTLPSLPLFSSLPVRTAAGSDANGVSDVYVYHNMCMQSNIMVSHDVCRNQLLVSLCTAPTPLLCDVFHRPLCWKPSRPCLTSSPCPSKRPSP